MRALLPYLALYKRHKWMLSLGIVLAIVTLLASIGLLTLSGWLPSPPQRLRGLPDCTASTICCPLGVRGAAITRTAGRYFERLVSRGASISACCSICAFTLSANYCPLPCRTGALSSGRITQPRGGEC